MPNPYFQFKQFTIWQDQCAMKVCTDACILGAWMAGKVKDRKTILDIGSGTGLQMLMLAQQNSANIKGIEIQEPAYDQLKQNLNLSPWKSRLQAYHGDARNFVFDGLFEFIISNPPFFENDLKSERRDSQLARHSTELNFENLLQIAQDNLLATGSLAVLIPFSRLNDFLERAWGKGFYLWEQLLIRQSPAHDNFRAVLHLGRSSPAETHRSELAIMDLQGQYTPEFIGLLKDYYLHL